MIENPPYDVIMKRFPEGALTELISLFGEKDVEKKLPRLVEIFTKTESSWRENLQRLENKEVEYLLLGEAPPWSEAGTVYYFYRTFDQGQNGRPITWIRGVWGSLIDFKPQQNVGDNLDQLAKNNFLLMDTLPFAMPYTTNIRKSAEYRKLVSMCSSYLLTRGAFRNWWINH